MEQSNSNFNIKNIVNPDIEDFLKGIDLDSIPVIHVSKEDMESIGFKIDKTGLAPTDIRHPSREEIEWMASVEGFNPDKMIEVEITHHIVNAIKHRDYGAYDKEEMKAIKKWLKKYEYHSSLMYVDDFEEVIPYESTCHVTGKKDKVVPVLILKK